MDFLSQTLIFTPTLTAILIITVFLLIVSTGIIILVMVYQKKQVQYLRDKQQLKINFDKEILESKLEIQEQTFKNISQEIHDNIGQVLSLTKLTINTMNCDDLPGLKEKIADSKLLITKAILDLRDLSKSFNTDFLNDLGLIESIKNELELIKKTGTYSIELKINGESYRLKKQQELIFFRIVQEAIHNIIRHAQATAIVIDVLFEPSLFTLRIVDNGLGFNYNLQELNNTPGLGIRNMKNRAHLINAFFSLESIVNKGTSIMLALPV